MIILKYWAIYNRNQDVIGVITTISYIYTTVNLIQLCWRESESKYSSCWCSECSICFHMCLYFYIPPKYMHFCNVKLSAAFVTEGERSDSSINTVWKHRKHILIQKTLYIVVLLNVNKIREGVLQSLDILGAIVKEMMNCWNSIWDLESNYPYFCMKCIYPLFGIYERKKCLFTILVWIHKCKHLDWEVLVELERSVECFLSSSLWNAVTPLHLCQQNLGKE